MLCYPPSYRWNVHYNKCWNRSINRQTFLLVSFEQNSQMIFSSDKPIPSCVDNIHRNVTSLRFRFEPFPAFLASDKEAAHCLRAADAHLFCLFFFFREAAADCLTPKNGSSEKKAICPHLFPLPTTPLSLLSALPCFSFLISAKCVQCVAC